MCCLARRLVHYWYFDLVHSSKDLTTGFLPPAPSCNDPNVASPKQGPITVLSPQRKADRSDVISKYDVGFQVNKSEVCIVVGTVTIVLWMNYDPVRTNDLFSGWFSSVSVQLTKAYLNITD